MEAVGDDGVTEAVVTGSHGNVVFRGRPTTKLKVLGRSHAMREEQSPPREPERPDADGAQPPDQRGRDAESPAGRRTRRPSGGDESRGSGGQSPQAVAPQTNGEKTECNCHSESCSRDRGGHNNNDTNMNNNVAAVSSSAFSSYKARGKLKQHHQTSQNSHNGLSFDGSSSSDNRLALFRDNSAEYYTDTTGTNLEEFIEETMNKNPKDRLHMLHVEDALIKFARDPTRLQHKFPHMTSYHRMLVHRCAAYFGMEHNLDSMKSVVVNKTRNTRIPEIRFRAYIKEAFNDEPPRRSILKRDSNSLDEYYKGSEHGYNMDERKNKSFEERTEEYVKVRQRIFSEEIGDSIEDISWSTPPWVPPPENYRRLLKVQSEEVEQSDRPCVAKSHSFGGYEVETTGLTRGDSLMSTQSAPGPRARQDSPLNVTGLSASSSGYKSQSQSQKSLTPSPPSESNLSFQSALYQQQQQQYHREAHCCGQQQLKNTLRPRNGVSNPVVFAVSDLSNVPEGSLIINPETGKPYKNDDGTIYYFDPKTLACTVNIRKTATLSPHDPSTTPVSSPSPEKQQTHLSFPAKSHHVTNSATSPSLPMSPSLAACATSTVQTDQNYPYGQAPNCNDTLLQPPLQLVQYEASAEVVPYYPHSYMVCTPYGVSIPAAASAAAAAVPAYDGRLEPPAVTELNATTYLASEIGTAPLLTAYQSPSVWNQGAVGFYGGAVTTPAVTQAAAAAAAAASRYTVPSSTAFVSSGYQSTGINYVPVQPPPISEVIYQNQPVQLTYPPSQSNGAVFYQTQAPPLYYTPNSSYYPTATSVPVYPPNAATPMAVPSSPLVDDATGLAQGVQQISFGPPSVGYSSVNAKCNQGCVPRRGSGCRQPFVNGFAKQNHHYHHHLHQRQAFFVAPANRNGGGGGTATGTVLAAATQPFSPSATPTPQYPVFNHSGPPRLVRQLSNDRGSSPGTAPRTSRSPTPRNDTTSFAPSFDWQRFVLPSPVLHHPHGVPMPYIVQSDLRMAGRGQPNVYRQTTTTTTTTTPPVATPIRHQNAEYQRTQNNYNNKFRKPRVNKCNGLPQPSGK